MFIGRKKELKVLENKYESDQFEMMVVYGRRRVGKSTLIKEFVKDKPAIIWVARHVKPEENLTSLSNSISYFEMGSLNASPVYKNYDDAFKKIARMAKNKRIVLVIDEYQCLAESMPAISSILQDFIDHVFKDTKLYIILTTSSMNLLENQDLGYKGPLYGRRTGQLKILPFDYYETGLWFPPYTNDEKAFVYGVTGGIPAYLEKFDSNLSFDENMKQNYFVNGGFFIEEVDELLKPQLRSIQKYHSILDAMVNGARRLSEIAEYSGVESYRVSYHLKQLEDLGIVKKQYPINKNSGRKTIYLIEDPFFKFWYSFVPLSLSFVFLDQAEQYYDNYVKMHLHEYMGTVFEEMCKQYLLRNIKNLPFMMKECGSWWGNHPASKKEVEIDIVVTSLTTNDEIIGSCKFKNTPIGLDEYELMKEYANVMNAKSNKYYYFFSKGGFKDSILQQNEVTCITLDDMYQLNESLNS